MNQAPKGRPLPESLRQRLREEVEKHGERVVRERLRLTRGPLARALAGLDIYEGTHALIELGFTVPEARAS